MLIHAAAVWLLYSSALAASAPPTRFHPICKLSGKCAADKERPEFGAHVRSSNLFVEWLRGVFARDSSLSRSFTFDTVPDDVHGFHALFDHLILPDEADNNTWAEPTSPTQEAQQLFAHLNFTLDPACTNDRANFYYRTYNGSCNWLKDGEASIGAYGTPKARDYDQTTYADGISQPRQGPNARAVSNAFFKRKQKLYYEHTPLLLGLIEVGPQRLPRASPYR